MSAPQPGFFELYPTVRPVLDAGEYTLVGSQRLVAATQTDGDVTVPVDDATFHLTVVSPRYTLPPDQMLSTYPPATSEGDWSDRLPQIVLKRRTLPWERNPGPGDPATAPPWLALVVVADGEAQIGTDTPVAQCITAGVALAQPEDADVARGSYLQVRRSVVQAVFPSRDELDLLCHVRRVDLSDTELALGDDDGWLAVVIANRLPLPGPPPAGTTDPAKQKYTACLINLEGQLDVLLDAEPAPADTTDTTRVSQYVDTQLLAGPPTNETLDVLGMGLGEVGGPALPMTEDSHAGAPVPAYGATFAPYGVGRGVEKAGLAWATGPTGPGRVANSSDLSRVAAYREGFGAGVVIFDEPTYRFPVLASWSFTATGSGGFGQLMSELDVGLLGTAPAVTVSASTDPTHVEVAATGHVALAHRTRQGEANTCWYRGPFGPQPTARVQAGADGVLPLAHVGDQLRKVVADGREDLSLAALFEIGRLLTLNKPSLVASLMSWRADLFGAGRARELARQLAESPAAGIAQSAAAGLVAIETVLRTRIVLPLAEQPAGTFGPPGRPVTPPRVPDEIAQLSPQDVLVGLGADPDFVARVAARGLTGLATVPLRTAPAPTEALSGDQVALATVGARLAQRVDQLVADSYADSYADLDADSGGLR